MCIDQLNGECFISIHAINYNAYFDVETQILSAYSVIINFWHSEINITCTFFLLW